MSFPDFLQKRLEASGSRHRELKVIEDYSPRKIRVDGQVYLNFSSNDYLGLSREQIQPGFSQPSSRLLGGGSSAHAEAERQLASWQGRDEAVLFPAGYMANTGMLTSLACRGDLLILDRLCHASLIDGARLSGAEMIRVPHLDFDALERQLQKHSSKRTCFYVTESLFSMDGDMPDFARLRELRKQYPFFVLVDEAHAVGVRGTEGRGILDEQDATDTADVVSFTLSKSFALQGGVLTGPAGLRRLLANRCRTLIYTTASPSVLVAAIPERLEKIKKAEAERIKLRELSAYAGTLAGLDDSKDSAIVPWHCPDDATALKLSQTMREGGFFCPAILPPTVPRGSSRLRMSLNCCHKKDDVTAFYECFKKVAGE